MSTAVPTLCLNMIVKNESKIIQRLLESVAPWIDSYCICDTGSTDNTMDIIQTFFESRQIPGRIFQEPFRDFGYNRTIALKECDKMGPLAQYALLLDADMVFWVNPDLCTSKHDFAKTIGQHEAICLLQGTDQFNYKNLRIVKCGIGASYWGVTHEYVQLPTGVDGSVVFAKSNAFIIDVGDGGAKADKFERDIRLLRQGLVDSPDNCRYTFYLANSLRDHGDTEEAIAMYEKRAALGGWVEEVWYSYFSMGSCYMRMNNPQRAVFAWMEGAQCFPERVENIYEIMHYYRTHCKYVVAQKYYAMAQRQLTQTPYENKSFLFMHRDVYDYKLDYEMTVTGYYCNPDRIDLAKLSMKVLHYPALPECLQKNVMSNYKFYVQPLAASKTSAYFTPSFFDTVTSNFPSFAPATTGFVKKGSVELFWPSTPTLVATENRILAVIRHVNYRIEDADGSYTCQDKIETRNWMLTLDRDPTTQTWSLAPQGGGRFLDYDRSHDARYVGIEDVRLFYDPTSQTVLYNGNRGLSDGRMVVETGTLCVEEGRLDLGRHLTTERSCEKNWVWASGSDMIYQWHPLTVKSYSAKDETKATKDDRVIPTPSWFQHVRGSCNAVKVDNELWFLCHAVSYESRRYYYHLVIMLDATTFQVQRHTRLFTFEQQPVEYALGFLYEPSTDEFLLGYSVMDRRTVFRVVPRKTLVDLCI